MDQPQTETLLTFSFRADRLARAIADKTASRTFNKPSRELWQLVYRNAFHAVRQEGPVVSRRVAIVSTVAAFVLALGLGLLLKGTL
jgi:hypothetical protein